MILKEAIVSYKKISLENITQIVCSSNDLANVCRAILKKNGRDDVENCFAVSLDTKLKVTAFSFLGFGSLDQCILVPRDVYRFACLVNASRVAVFHNHPSGDPTPSNADSKITSILTESGQIIEIPLLDHIILGDGQSYYSFKDARRI